MYTLPNLSKRKTKIIFFNFIGLTFLKRVRLYCYAYYTERDITMNAIQSTTILIMKYLQ